MSDTKTTSIVGNQLTTTSSHNSGEDVTYILRNEIGAYAKLETGSGTIAVATAGTKVTASVTFPIAFSKVPQAVRVILTNAPGGDAGYINLYPTAITATGFTLNANAYVAQTLSYNYIVIGV